MDFDNRNSFGSVRRLRDRFEQNNVEINVNNNNNNNCNKTRNCVNIKDLFDKNESKNRSSLQCKQIKSIADKSFAEKLNKTLRNDSKIFNNPNINLIKNIDHNPLISSNNSREPSPSPVPKSIRLDMGLSSEPNPVPKPPRTFAHDVYLELKFNTKNSTNNCEEKAIPIYSQPNKAKKWKNRLRSQSDSEVMETKKTNEFKSNENIYDDCITTRSSDKTIKSKLLQFSCLKFKR